METCSIGESAQKKDQGSRDGDGETETQQRNWRRRYPADTGCSRAMGLNQRVAIFYRGRIQLSYISDFHIVIHNSSKIRYEVAM